jgi:serine/threonine-protein kinase
MHEAPKVLGGKWRVERRLGAGGMGAVYLATDLTLGRRVAVKLLHASLAEDKTFVARFLREARVMARLDHPSIMPIFACEQAPEGVLLVMKYIEGPTLSAHLKAMGRLSASGTAELLKQLSAGVSLMHRHGLVHRAKDRRHRAPHPTGYGPGHGRVHGARAGARSSHRPAHRPLLGRRHRLSVSHR